MPGSSRRLLWALILIGSLVSLALTAAIARQQLIFGSFEGGWIYPYIRVFGYRPLRVWLMVSIAAGMLLAVPERVIRRREWLVVAAWVILGFGMQAAVRAALSPVRLEPMFTSDGANSFYGVTLHYRPTTVLRDFSQLRASWPLHAQSNMPGKLILTYALELVSTRPAVLAWLVVFVSSLGGVFLYFFVRDLFADHVVALYSLVLYLVVPAKLAFFPLLNTVTPALVFLCAFLLVRWLRRSQPACAALLGVSLYALVFFEPTALAIGLLFAALIVHALAGTTARAGTAGRAGGAGRAGTIFSARTLVLQGGLAVLTFAASHLFMRWAYSFDLFSALQHVVVDGVTFNQNERPYWIWIRQNPLEFFIGIGGCQAFVFWALLANNVRRTGWRERLASPIAIVTLGLAATLAAIDLMGVNRGEVTRLWIFLACAFQIPAAYVCARLQNRRALMLVLTTTLLQDALATSMIGFVNP